MKLYKTEVGLVIEADGNCFQLPMQNLMTGT